MNNKNIDQFMTHVNQTFEQAKQSSFRDWLLFALYGMAKVIAFGAVLWLIRHV